MLPSVRGLKPVSKTPPALQSPLRTPMGVHEAASGTGMSATAVDSDAQAIEEFREKFIKSGAIKFASLREAFRKIDANKNGGGGAGGAVAVAAWVWSAACLAAVVDAV